MFSVRQHDARTLSWWYDERESIDMDPPYQRRGGVWQINDKSYLIDSILNRYDIPKIYLADFSAGASPLNIGKMLYAVIDGKQRLESIFGFFDGEVLLARNFVLEDDPTLNLGGLSYRDLKLNFPRVASRFDNYNLSVMSVVSDDEAKINAIFVRLNRSKPLTGAELRNAMHGRVPALIRDIADHEFMTSKVKFNKNRGQDRNLAAKLMLIEFRGEFVDVKRFHLDRFVQQGVSADAPLAEFERAADRVKGVLDKMTEIFVDNDPLLTSEGTVPVYYWLVRGLPDAQLPSVRTFLVGFEELRRLNRIKARTSSQDEGVDVALLQYDHMNRSTNDQGSLEGRYKLLSDRFRIALSQASQDQAAFDDQENAD